MRLWMETRTMSMEKWVVIASVVSAEQDTSLFSRQHGVGKMELEIYNHVKLTSH